MVCVYVTRPRYRLCTHSPVFNKIESKLTLSRDPLSYNTPRRVLCRGALFTASVFGLAVCIAFLPVARSVSVSAAMETARTSQAGLVRYLKRALRIASPRVERALLAVDRKHFVDASVPLYVVYQVQISPMSAFKRLCKDIPLPIGFDETISAPHMHATCLELLEEHAKEHTRILDVGSGSGYLTAALALLAGPESFVLGVEKHQELAAQSILNIEQSNPELMEGPSPRVQIQAGNALSTILSDVEPFDAIHVGAAAASVPNILVEKLNPGGRMVIPVGPRSTFQELMCIDKDDQGRVSMESLMQVRYVPLTKPTDGPGSVPVN